MCQLYNAELSKYIMNLTEKQLQQGVPKVRYVKQAAECLRQQPGSHVWVLNESVHLDENGELGSMVSNRCLTNVVPASDAALIPLRCSPQDTFNDTLASLKQAVDNNYVPAFIFISSASMALHYQMVMEKYGMCPTPVAIGLKSTGKRTAAQTALTLLGTPQFFIRELTIAQNSVLT